MYVADIIILSIICYTLQLTLSAFMSRFESVVSLSILESSGGDFSCKMAKFCKSSFGFVLLFFFFICLNFIS